MPGQRRLLHLTVQFLFFLDSVEKWKFFATLYTVNDNQNPQHPRRAFIPAVVDKELHRFLILLSRRGLGAETMPLKTLSDGPAA